MKHLTWRIDESFTGVRFVAGFGDGRTAFVSDAKSGGVRLPGPASPVLLTIRDDESDLVEYLFEVPTMTFAKQVAAMVASGDLVVHTGYRSER